MFKQLKKCSHLQYTMLQILFMHYVNYDIDLKYEKNIVPIMLYEYSVYIKSPHWSSLNTGRLFF